MPQLSEPKHETYATLRAGGLSKTQAAINAGYGSGPANTGSRLEKRPEVRERIKELEATQQIDKTDSTADISAPFQRKAYIVTETVSIHKLAKKAKEYSTSLNCLRFLAQLGGLLDNGKGVTGQSGPKSLTQINISAMTSKQLGEFLRSEAGGLDPAERKRLLSAVPEISAELDSDPLTPQSES